MAAKKKRAPKKAAAPTRDPREAPSKVLCPVCGTQVPEEDLRPYLDPETGGEAHRCGDCERQALEPAPEEPEEPEEQEEPAVIPTPQPTRARTDRNLLVQTLCDLPHIGVPGGRALADAHTVIERIVRMLAEQELSGEAQVDHLKAANAEQRQRLEEYGTQVQRLSERLRDLETLLGMDGEPVGGLEQAQPWMLEYGAGLAAEAPQTLDERSLALLIVEGLTRGFAHRTLAQSTTLQEIAKDPACAALLRLEEAARGVSAVLRSHPDMPADLRRDAITEAWEGLQVASAHARAGVVHEVDRLLELEHTERERLRPRLAPAGEGKQFRVARGVGVEDVPAEDLPMPDEDGDDDDDESGT